MKTLRTQAIEDGAIPANENKPQLSKAWNETVNLVAKLPGAPPSKERFQVTWFDDVDQSAAQSAPSSRCRASRQERNFCGQRQGG
jgi:hypothetical protein